MPTTERQGQRLGARLLRSSTAAYRALFSAKGDQTYMASSDRHRPLGYRNAVLSGLLILVSSMLLLAAVPGCGGCRKSDDVAKTEEEKKKEELEEKKRKAKKPEFEFRNLETIPSEEGMNRSFVKPGHAVTGWMTALANYDDLRAEFETYVSDVSNRPIPVGNTRYHMVMSRPAVLPKGQEKYLESTFFIPGESEEELGSVFLQHKLKSARGGLIVHEASQIASQMPAYQYLFPVLSSNPNAWGYLKQMESISPPFEDMMSLEGHQILYRVVLPSVDQRVPLPAHPFSWTTIAFVLWDGLQPSAMTPDQQAAMLDWLHWGGQLIVNGPSSLERLGGSFLDPYLPVKSLGAVTLGSDSFSALNSNWAMTRDKPREPLTLNVPESSPLVGVQLAPRSEGQFIEGTGQLVAEGRVGRGRIVVTAFSLSSRDIVNWRSYDGFFNACILRHPPRTFSVTDMGGVVADWYNVPASRADPRIVTATRYFTRDTDTVLDQEEEAESLVQPLDWHLDGSKANGVAGMGGWNDRSGPSSTAHATLQAAAGISIPKASFVLSVLAVYLVVLVPINWGLFRLIGRVEWAWFAAPAIAIVGAIAVIRLAQLDIGFVRSRTEIGIVEVYGGYRRAHLTRYIALYSSLSSNYELVFDQSSAYARPFPPTESPDQISPVTFRRDRDVRLNGFRVRSNSTGFIHAEEMHELGGPIQLIGDGPRQWQVQNSSELDLHGVGVLYRSLDGTVLTCWLPQLPAKTTAPLPLAPSPDGDPWLPQWERPPQRAEADSEAPTANLKSLTQLAALGTRLRRGEVRLVGWSEGLIPGLTISPTASQAKGRCVVLVHLRQGPLPLPVRDQNLSVDKQTEVPSRRWW